MTAGLGSGEETITSATHGFSPEPCLHQQNAAKQCISIDLSTDTVSQDPRPVSAVV